MAFYRGVEFLVGDVGVAANGGEAIGSSRLRP